MIRYATLSAGKALDITEDPYFLSFIQGWNAKTGDNAAKTAFGLRFLLRRGKDIRDIVAANEPPFAEWAGENGWLPDIKTAVALLSETAESLSGTLKQPINEAAVTLLDLHYTDSGLNAPGESSQEFVDNVMKALQITPAEAPEKAEKQVQAAAKRIMQTLPTKAAEQWRSEFSYAAKIFDTAAQTAMLRASADMILCVLFPPKKSGEAYTDKHVKQVRAMYESFDYSEVANLFAFFLALQAVMLLNSQKTSRNSNLTQTIRQRFRRNTFSLRKRATLAGMWLKLTASRLPIFGKA